MNSNLAKAPAAPNRIAGSAMDKIPLVATVCLQLLVMLLSRLVRFIDPAFQLGSIILLENQKS